MAISINGLDPDPVKVPIGSPTAFLILGKELRTKGLEVKAVKDTGGTPVDNVTLSIDKNSATANNRLPVVALANFGAIPGNYLVALLLDGTIEDTHPGLIVQ